MTIKTTFVRMCRTEYKGPTDHNGSRIIGTHITTKRRIIRSWDHALNSLDNHASVAAELLGSEELMVASIEGGGYMFACVPKGEE